MPTLPVELYLQVCDHLSRVVDCWLSYVPLSSQDEVCLIAWRALLALRLVDKNAGAAATPVVFRSLTFHSIELGPVQAAKLKAFQEAGLIGWVREVSFKLDMRKQPSWIDAFVPRRSGRALTAARSNLQQWDGILLQMPYLSKVTISTASLSIDYPHPRSTRKHDMVAALLMHLRQLSGISLKEVAIEVSYWQERYERELEVYSIPDQLCLLNKYPNPDGGATIKLQGDCSELQRLDWHMKDRCGSSHGLFSDELDGMGQVEHLVLCPNFVGLTSASAFASVEAFGRLRSITSGRNAFCLVPEMTGIGLPPDASSLGYLIWRNAKTLEVVHLDSLLISQDAQLSFWGDIFIELESCPCLSSLRLRDLRYQREDEYRSPPASSPCTLFANWLTERYLREFEYSSKTRSTGIVPEVRHQQRSEGFQEPLESHPVMFTLEVNDLRTLQRLYQETSEVLSIPPFEGETYACPPIQTLQKRYRELPEGSHARSKASHEMSHINRTVKCTQSLYKSVEAYGNLQDIDAEFANLEQLLVQRKSRRARRVYNMRMIEKAAAMGVECYEEEQDEDPEDVVAGEKAQVEHCMEFIRKLKPVKRKDTAHAIPDLERCHSELHVLSTWMDGPDPVCKACDDGKLFSVIHQELWDAGIKNTGNMWGNLVSY